VNMASVDIASSILAQHQDCRSRACDASRGLRSNSVHRSLA
jgi:hypothetical protein